MSIEVDFWRTMTPKHCKSTKMEDGNNKAAPNCGTTEEITIKNILSMECIKDKDPDDAITIQIFRTNSKGGVRGSAYFQITKKLLEEMLVGPNLYISPWKSYDSWALNKGGKWGPFYHEEIRQKVRQPGTLEFLEEDTKKEAILEIETVADGYRNTQDLLLGGNE